MDAKALIDRLRANVDKLSEKDQQFAYSLLGARKGLSAKQMFWVEKLGARATQSELPLVVIGNVAPIIDMLEFAAKRLKFPVIAMQGEYKLRVSIAGAAARVPGSITVTGADKDRLTGRRPWYGRITRDGGYEQAGAMLPEEAEHVASTLKAFAADPAGEASRYGKLNGRCCFCQLELTDDRSVAVGYGKRCAENHGLPWGEAPKLKLVAA